MDVSFAKVDSIKFQHFSAPSLLLPLPAYNNEIQVRIVNHLVRTAPDYGTTTGQEVEEGPFEEITDPVHMVRF